MPKCSGEFSYILINMVAFFVKKIMVILSIWFTHNCDLNLVYFQLLDNAYDDSINDLNNRYEASTYAKTKDSSKTAYPGQSTKKF